MAALLGIEPRTNESKSFVIPFHHSATVTYISLPANFMLLNVPPEKHPAPLVK